MYLVDKDMRQCYFDAHGCYGTDYAITEWYFSLEQTTGDTMETHNVDTMLDERGSRYGTFRDHAHLTQSLKESMQIHPNWDKLDHDMKESLEMIQHKIGRIINGDATYLDSWDDIIGYTKLITDRLRGIIK